MELTLDILKNDAFKAARLHRVAGKSPYVPQTLGMMRLFEPKPSDTTTILLYQEETGFTLIPTTERGGPDVQQVRRGGAIRALETLRLSKKDTVRAGELTGIANKALPETVRIRNAQDLVNKRTMDLKSDLEATKEWHRLAALQGKLYDVDGTTLLVDYFAEYGIAEPATISFAFASIANGALALKISKEVRDPIIDVLKANGRLTPQTKVHGLVGDNFWYSIIEHPEMRARWEAQENARFIATQMNPLIQPLRYESIEVGNVVFHHYEGASDGEIEVDTDSAIFFPVGAKDVFVVYWSPGETLNDATEMGRPEYLYLQPDTRDRMPEFLDIFIRAYPLYACIFPDALLKGAKTS